MLDVELSDIGFFGIRKNYIGSGFASSDIIFPHPKKAYIGLLTIQYSYNVDLLDSSEPEVIITICIVLGPMCSMSRATICGCVSDQSDRSGLGNHGTTVYFAQR